MPQEGLIGVEVSQFGLKRLLRKLDPARVTQARDRALDRGARITLAAIQEQSRVRSGAYKARWTIITVPDGRAVVNDKTYAEFVTGNTMMTTRRGGARAGAGEAFMRKIRRELSMQVRRTMQEMIREIVR